MEFIAGPRPEGCVFCPALKEGKPSRDLLVLHVGKEAAIIMNRFPYGHGHLLVLPRRHTSEFTGLTEAESLEIERLLKACVQVLTHEMSPHGFNLGLNLGQAAGAGIADHLHWHILPRWSGDTNFLALLAETRSIPEHLLVTYDRLRPRFAALLEGKGA